MVNKGSLAYILTTASTPRGTVKCASPSPPHGKDGGQRASGCMRRPSSNKASCLQRSSFSFSSRHVDSSSNNIKTKVVSTESSAFKNPLTTYLAMTREAPRVTCVRVRPPATHLHREQHEQVQHPIKEQSHDPQAECQQQQEDQTPPPLEPTTRKSSKFCIVEGCASRAKHARRCWKHGGSVKCKIADCVNRAKSKGVCWSHGGGSACSVAHCGTIAVSNGFCWAHGGGKRCRERGCSRPAYERTHNLCAQHYEECGYLTALARSTSTVI